MKDYLEKLNDIEIDLSEYKEEPLTDIQSTKIKKRLKKKIAKKNTKYIKVAAILLAIVFSPILINSVDAAIKYVSKSLESLGVYQNDDLKDYKDIIGTIKKNKDYTIQLNEIAFYNNKFYVSSTITKNEGELPNSKEPGYEEFKELEYAAMFVYVNDKQVSIGGGIIPEKIDDKSYFGLSKLYLEDGFDVKGPAKVKVVFSNQSKDNLLDEDSIIFEFDTNIKTLEQYDKEISINKDIIVNNTKIGVINKVNTTKIEVLINTTVDNKSPYEIDYIVKDNKGNKLQSSGTEIKDMTYFKNAFYIGDYDRKDISVTPVIKDKSNGNSYTLEPIVLTQ